MARRFRSLLLAAGSCVAWFPASAQTAPDDSSNPHYKQAQQDLESNDPNAATSAAAEYEAALAANPKLADAHYELGVIYAEKLSEPISAIYHLDQYLKMAPNSEHAASARELVTTESEAFAASLPGSSSSAALAKLQIENAGLKKQAEDAGRTIVQLQQQLAQANARAVVSAPEPVAGAPPPAIVPVPAGPAPALASTTGAAPVVALSGTNTAAAPEAGGAKTYTVRSGDSLWKIAHKMYPHDTTNGEEKIKDANKDVFNGKFLKPGQVLIIPQ